MFFIKNRGDILMIRIFLLYWQMLQKQRMKMSVYAFQQDWKYNFDMEITDDLVDDRNIMGLK